ncbi:MAG: two-component system sensor histidine kinase NtrB [Dongiaceae bacterium]
MSASPVGPLPAPNVARDLLARIVDAVTNPIFVKDEQHRVVVVNDAFGALLGRSRDEIVGRTDFDFVPAEEARIFQAKDRVVLRSGIPDENEESLTNAAGITHWIVTRKSLIMTPDGGRYIVGVITDITERRKAELELREAHENLKAAMEKLASTERLATIGQVAATVSHELRNPLGAIRNSMALVHQMTAGKQLGVERALDRVDRNIERCTTIITALLEFTHKKEIARMPTAIDAWLGDVLAECRIPEDVVLSRDLAAGDKVAIDKQRLRQVVVHLVDNAAQALKDPVWKPAEGHPRRITVRSESAGPDVMLTIVDTGPGIGPDVLPRIFEPLFTTKSFGVGLGLPTVRRIVEQHGGTIDVDSIVGVGTTVNIRLPRLTETDPPRIPVAGRDALA